MVSVKETSRQWIVAGTYQEDEQKRTIDEVSKRTYGGVKTGVHLWSRDKRRGDLFTGCVAPGIEVA